MKSKKLLSLLLALAMVMRRKDQRAPRDLWYSV